MTNKKTKTKTTKKKDKDKDKDPRLQPLVCNPLYFSNL